MSRSRPLVSELENTGRVILPLAVLAALLLLPRAPVGDVEPSHTDSRVGLGLTVAGFALGALPFAVWLGRLVLRREIRDVGDGNPGAANAWRAGGWPVGVTVVLLDVGKGALPVALARYAYQVGGLWLVPVVLAPALGHAFSPFLRWRGGKAVAATFGIWTGLTLWEGPTVLGLLCGAWMAVQERDAWSALLAMAGLGVYLLARGVSGLLLLIWLGNMLLLVWTHRRELRAGPRLRGSR